MIPATTGVDSYLDAAVRPWPHDALCDVVKAIRDCGPFDESIKWGNPFFGVNGRAVVKLFAAKEWINVFYYRGAELPDPRGVLESEGRTAMRRVRIQRNDVVDRKTLVLLTRAAADLERDRK